MFIPFLKTILLSLVSVLKLRIMKKLFTFALMIAFGASTAFAQFINEEYKSMSQGEHSSLSIELPKANEKDVQNLWEKFTKKDMKGKSKYDRKTGEVHTEGARIADMSYNAFDMYATTEVAGAGTLLTVWVDLGGEFLNSDEDADEYKAIEKQLYAFALVVARKQLEDQVKDEKKQLKKYESELKKLSKEKEGYENDIKKAKELIAQREREIEQNLTDQDNKALEIEAQKRVIESTQEKIGDLN